MGIAPAPAHAAKEATVSQFGFQQPFDLDNNEDSYSNNCDWEIAFFEGIVGSAPKYVEALANLGNLYTKRGDYYKGLEIDKRLVELLPDDPIIHYNLACSLSLTDDRDAALVELQKAIQCGYSDYTYMLEDEDLESVRNDPRFFELMARFSKPV